MSVAAPGEKRHLGWLRHYLVAATRGAGAGASSAAGASGGVLHLYDLRNKLVAASLPLPEVRVMTHVLRRVAMRGAERVISHAL